MSFSTYCNFCPVLSLKAFKKRTSKEEKNEIKRNDALVALQKALYLKRLESSLIAFGNSIRNQRNFQAKFYEIFTQQGKLLDSNVLACPR